jgi:hypothetical protein
MAGTDEELQKLWDEEAAIADPETPAPEPEPEPEPAPEPEPEDPFAGLPQAVRDKLAQIDDLHKANEDLRHHVRTTEGRVAAWQRERDKQQQEIVAAPSPADVAKASADSEKWTQLKSDFPEWAEAMEEYVSAKVGAGAQGIPASQLNQLLEERTAQIRAENQEALEYAKLEIRHEDWKETINGEEFKSWMQTQPVDVYNLVHSPKASDAVKMLDLYKAAKQPPPESAVDAIRNQRKATISSAVTTKPGASRPSKTVDAMTPDELWNYEARQREKKRAQQGF